jgi:hypothetical protein
MGALCPLLCLESIEQIIAITGGEEIFTVEKKEIIRKAKEWNL